MKDKWHPRIEPKGYQCRKVYKREVLELEDWTTGEKWTEEYGPAYEVEGCEWVDISLKQYQCRKCGTIGNY